MRRVLSVDRATAGIERSDAQILFRTGTSFVQRIWPLGNPRFQFHSCIAHRRFRRRSSNWQPHFQFVRGFIRRAGQAGRSRGTRRDLYWRRMRWTRLFQKSETDGRTVPVDRDRRRSTSHVSHRRFRPLEGQRTSVFGTNSEPVQIQRQPRLGGRCGKGVSKNRRHCRSESRGPIGK